MQLSQLYKLFVQHPVISTDSRNCPSGSLFFALKGTHFDANAFAHQALENGAAYAIIDNPAWALNERYIVVNDTLATLQDLAKHHRNYLKTPIIAITGTNGKTTSKELIASVLSQKFKIHYTKGNFNNHIGVPLTLLQLEVEHQMAVIEMGANHVGEIKMLSDITCPDYGIVTNVGLAHLEGFGSFEGVRRAKSELYQNMATHAKKIFINIGNAYLNEMATWSGFEDDSRKVKYAVNDQTHNSICSGYITSNAPLLQMHCQLADGTFFDVNTQLIGSYNAENIVAAATIGHYFGLSWTEIKKGLESYRPQNNRSQLTITERNKLVVDAYNANPTSMHAAILNFADMHVPSKLVVLGDMLELGEQAAMEHQKIIDLLVEKELKEVFLVGEYFCQTHHPFASYTNIAELITALTDKKIENRYILIKGSRGIGLEKLIDHL